jgi:hypothetical protein
VRELVGRADDERVEGVTRVQSSACIGRHSLGQVGVGRRRRLVGRRGGRPRPFRHEYQGGLGPAHLGQRFGQHHRVMLGQPVLEEGIGNANGDRAPTVCDERGGLEPGIKTVTVNLGFDPGEDLIPDARVHCVTRNGSTVENNRMGSDFRPWDPAG